MRLRILLPLLVAPSAFAAEDRKVDPTWLYRRVADVQPQPSDFTTPSCRYKPLFGAGDRDSRIVRGVARFGEMTVEAGGSSAIVNYPAEEQVYVILEGSGTVHYEGRKVPVKKSDYVYFAPAIAHGLSASPGGACRAVVMGFRIPQGTQTTPPAAVPIANMEDVKKEVVGSHPPTTLYQLLMGDVNSKRDRLAVARVLTSLFTMEFAPTGTNFPHHHDREEEIYLVLEGYGDMVAGGGMDGVEGRHPARAGDAYFFRLNCTVGFYAGNKPGEPKARILAVRSLYPRMR